METVLVVLGKVGLAMAFVLGLLITIGVIPLDRYFEAHQDKKARERRARESLGRSTNSRA